MTDYTNNRFLKQMDQWIQDRDWYKGQVVKLAGKFPLGTIPNNQEFIQLDKLYALGAVIKKSDQKEFPAEGITEMKSMLRKIKWFNGLIGWTEEQYEDYTAGNPYEVERTRTKLDAVDFTYDKDIESWFVGYGTTFTSDVDYDDKWIPWMKLQSNASETMSNPADMNAKVTNMAGTTGTTAVELHMTSKLTSTTTNQTIDFAQKTFGPWIDAFTDFEDSNTGRHMATPRADGENPKAPSQFQVHVAPKLANKFFQIKVFDGEKYLDRTIADDMHAMGIQIVPNRQFTALFVEDAGGGEGKCQFGFTSDFGDNFQIGIGKPMNWEADKKITGVKDKWIKRMTSRLVPYTHPYWDGSSWYKAFGAGAFYYMNDS